VDIISNIEFSKKTKETPDGNYLFYGEEDYLKSHAIKSLKDAMGIDEALEIFNFVTLDVLDYTPDKLIDMLSMPPMNHLIRVLPIYNQENRWESL
jgi:DNA polymerase III delta subunit